MKNGQNYVVKYGAKKSYVEHGSEGDDLSAEETKLGTDTPNWAVSQCSSLYAHVYGVRCFCTMCSDIQNATVYDRAGVR